MLSTEVANIHHNGARITAAAAHRRTKVTRRPAAARRARPMSGATQRRATAAGVKEALTSACGEREEFSLTSACGGGSVVGCEAFPLVPPRNRPSGAGGPA